MIDAGSEALPAAQATAICQAIYPSTRHSKSLFNGLIVEGVLLQERVETGEGRADTVRFTYQRLSDHLRAEVLLERNTSNTELAAAVRELPDKQRTAVTLRYMADLTNAEIAQVMGTSTEAARRSVYEALEKLRAQIGDDLTTLGAAASQQL